MRILLLTEFYGDSPGGVETHVKGLQEELERKGHELIIVTPERKRWDWLIGPNPLLRSFYYFIKALPHVSKADAIYTIYTLSPFLAGVLLKLITGKRLIAGIWNIEALEKIRGSAFLKWAVDQADDVMFFTESHRRLLPRGHVVPNWVDLKLFKPGKSAIRRKLGWQKEFVIVFVGRPTKGKGLHTLMQSVSKLDCKLLIVGSFVDDAYFKQLAKQLDIEKKAHFVGKVAHGKLPDFYRAADVFCVPSTIFEGQGIVFIEAMACGKAIVSTNLPAIRDTVGNAGIYVKPEDAKGLLEALRELKKDASFRKRLAANALRIARKYSQKEVMRRYFEVLLKRQFA